MTVWCTGIRSGCFFAVELTISLADADDCSQRLRGSRTPAGDKTVVQGGLHSKVNLAAALGGSGQRMSRRSHPGPSVATGLNPDLRLNQLVNHVWCNEGTQQKHPKFETSILRTCIFEKTPELFNSLGFHSSRVGDGEFLLPFSSCWPG